MNNYQQKLTKIKETNQNHKDEKIREEEKKKQLLLRQEKLDSQLKAEDVDIENLEGEINELDQEIEGLLEKSEEILK